MDLSLLPLKPGDQLWRSLEDGSSWHALPGVPMASGIEDLRYVGQFLLDLGEDGETLTLRVGESLPPRLAFIVASIYVLTFFGESRCEVGGGSVRGCSGQDSSAIYVYISLCPHISPHTSQARSYSQLALK